MVLLDVRSADEPEGPGAVPGRRHERERRAATERGDSVFAERPRLHLGGRGDVLRVDLREPVAPGRHDDRRAEDDVLEPVAGLPCPCCSV